MSSGGAISSMVTSIRNNRRERKSKLEKLKNTSNHREKNADPIKASPELLRNIRTKLQIENRTKTRKAIAKTGVLLLLITVLIYVFNKNWHLIYTFLN
jgi:hypothetical protein